MVSNIVYFHPYLGKIPFWLIFFKKGWSYQLENPQVDDGTFWMDYTHFLMAFQVWFDRDPPCNLHKEIHTSVGFKNKIRWWLSIEIYMGVFQRGFSVSLLFFVFGLEWIDHVIMSCHEYVEWIKWYVVFLWVSHRWFVFPQFKIQAWLHLTWARARWVWGRLMVIYRNSGLRDSLAWIVS